jgi:hypothetical protein
VEPLLGLCDIRAASEGAAAHAANGGAAGALMQVAVPGRAALRLRPLVVCVCERERDGGREMERDGETERRRDGEREKDGERGRKQRLNGAWPWAQIANEVQGKQELARRGAPARLVALLQVVSLPPLW